MFLGLDVGKSDHHAVALDPAGKRLHDAPLPNTEAGPRKLSDKLGRHGRILAVVDQPASIGALPVAVARAWGHQVGYLPGLVMRRLADLHPGTAKTDARDAYVIADAARTLPHTLRRIDAGDDTLAELEMLVGYDDDLAGESRASLTGSADCSPRSTHHWNACSARKCSIPPSSKRCRGVVDQPGCVKPAGRNSPRSSNPGLRGWAFAWLKRSSPPLMLRRCRWLPDQWPDQDLIRSPLSS
ncbi:hypothetical protein Ade02nite_95430 [Paractinoplanes deccanensis]|uniref:Transposase IS110-like N-terminal domain-containing protein n=1 Tax=Paractinoplanes deccanensis TaxID=113561 RepID=A0ABQ3YLR5_9ACTN|nr:hypothetical protein Ade02nite_95430 [Actinoplanes deccanensis]